jgi:hypothetical protein
MNFKSSRDQAAPHRARPSLARLRALALASTVLVCLVVFLAPRSAHAYPWMIRHEYTGCSTCHVDPSGGGVLTEYGRAQGDILLRTHYGASASDDVPSSAGFLWGAVHPPDWFLPGGSVRYLGYAVKDGSAKYQLNSVLMQADLRAAIVSGGFRAAGSVGFVGVDNSPAAISGSIVSREYWAGWAFGKDQAFLLRAGRINVPFGLRQIEHTLLVRVETRSDLNDTQQHGVALAYSSERVRAEVMAIAGNYQVSPDMYRERGYSGYAEYAPVSNAAIGVSSLVTHAARDRVWLLPNTRQAHGVFGRWAPLTPLVLMAEADLLRHSALSSTGYVTMLQADVEPIQGVHLIAAGENLHRGERGNGTTWGAWLGAGWFFAPHADARFDFVHQSQAFGTVHVPETQFLLQLHVYL